MRIAVKNLPYSSTKELIHDHFKDFGTITDIYLLYNNDNSSSNKVDKKFRRICFVGYKTEAEAKRAVKVKNRTFIKNQRIVVELEGESLKKMKNVKIDIEKKIENKEYDENSEESENGIANNYELVDLETPTLEIRNLPYIVKEEDLSEHFKKFGKIENINLEVFDFDENGNILDSKKEIANEFDFDIKKKVLCQITFNQIDSAKKCLSSNNSYFMGRKLIVYPKKPSVYANYLNSLFFDFKTVLKQSESLFSSKKKSDHFSLFPIYSIELIYPISTL